MGPMLLVATVVILVAVCYPVIRLMANHYGILSDIHSDAEQAQPAPAPLEQEPAPSGYPPVCDTPFKRRFGGLLSLLFILVGGGFLYGLTSGKISLDALYNRLHPPKAQTSAVVSEPSGLDWKLVDGIRWFHVTGTDSAGIGYSGWVSELFFLSSPPKSTPEGKDILEKLGLPSFKERLEAAKQLREVGSVLQQALKNN
ncbi:MAG TPA: hypothetical protein VIV61_05755 [Candidatus Ozemobacteraceae bacterium]